MTILTSSISASIIFNCAFLESIIASKDKISDSNVFNWYKALSYSSLESSYSFSEIYFFLNNFSWLSKFFSSFWRKSLKSFNFASEPTLLEIALFNSDLAFS